MVEEILYALGVDVPCPKCELGNGLRKADAFELMLTGWEGYEFLHCDTCGANFVGRGGEWMYMKYQIPKVCE